MGEQPTTAANAIELRIEEISQLFHTLDPFPFREKDLDADAEEFIVSWARELPPDQALKSSCTCQKHKHPHLRPVNSMPLSRGTSTIAPRRPRASSGSYFALVGERWPLDLR